MLKYFLELSNPPGKVPSHSCSTTTRCWSRYICRTICRATSSQISRSFCLGFFQKNRKRCGRAFVLKHSLELSDPPGKVPSHSWTICRATFSLILRPFCLYRLQTDLTRNYLNVASGINYPNQPKSIPDSHLSDPLTYWWGVSLCPPELNDVALAETVVILMRLAAMREMRLNEEVNKPSIAEVLEFKGYTMDCSVESTPHEDACIYSSTASALDLSQNGIDILEFQDSARNSTMSPS